jgi:hypothetical protein
MIESLFHSAHAIESIDTIFKTRLNDLKNTIGTYGFLPYKIQSKSLGGSPKQTTDRRSTQQGGRFSRLHQRPINRAVIANLAMEAPWLAAPSDL